MPNIVQPRGIFGGLQGRLNIASKRKKKSSCGWLDLVCYQPSVVWNYCWEVPLGLFNESIQGFILNESEGGSKPSFGLYLGPIDRQTPNMSWLLCSLFSCFKLEYKLLSIWIREVGWLASNSFLCSRATTLSIESIQVWVQSGLHYLLEFTQDCILITEKYSVSIIAATGRGGTKNYLINHSSLSIAYICRLYRRNKSNHLIFFFFFK